MCSSGSSVVLQTVKILSGDETVSRLAITACRRKCLAGRGRFPRSSPAHTLSPRLRDLLPSGVPATEAADSNAIMTPRTGDLVSSRRVTDWQARGPD